MQIIEEFRHFTSPTVIYVADIDSKINALLKDDYTTEVLLRCFTLKEQVKIRSKVLLKDRNKDLISRLFSRLILNVHLSKSGAQNIFKDVNLEYNEFGKPMIKGIQFNSSSSNDIISMVIQNQNSPVGIDLSHLVQKINPKTCVQDFESIFDVSEYDFLSNIEDVDQRYQVFNQFWTLKEAYTKYLGVGLNVDLSKIKFNVSKDSTILNSGEEKIFDLNSKIMKEVKIDWTKDISVDTELIKGEKTIYCNSGKLFSIYISVVSEVPFVNDIRVLKVDMSTLIEEFMQSHST